MTLFDNVGVRPRLFRGTLRTAANEPCPVKEYLCLGYILPWHEPHRNRSGGECAAAPSAVAVGQTVLATNTQRDSKRQQWSENPLNKLFVPALPSRWAAPSPRTIPIFTQNWLRRVPHKRASISQMGVKGMDASQEPEHAATTGSVNPKNWHPRRKYHAFMQERIRNRPKHTLT